MRFAAAAVALLALASLSPRPGLARADAPADVFVSGYMIIPTQGRVDAAYNAGFSMYVAAWPLLRHYPGHRFQTGLPGTWMFAQYPGGHPPENVYSDVEGGLGWWTDTRFPTETPKFIMGGVGPNFSEIANGPGHGAGTWDRPRGLYGVAQLSPWLLFPPDGLNLQQGTCGQLFGYGYLNLPLCDPKATTDDKPVPTGGNCWTLFLNTGNFKGPAAFFTPYFWSQAGVTDAMLAGQLLDTRPAEPNTALQMETQYIPCRVARGPAGQMYARIAPTSYPRSLDGSSVLMTQVTSYNNTALWNRVRDWFAGGQPCSGEVDAGGAAVRRFGSQGYMTWEIETDVPGQPPRKTPIDWRAFVRPSALGPATFGCKWDYGLAKKTQAPPGDLVTLPEYYRLENASDPKKARWEPVAPDSVPPDTGLRALQWGRAKEPVQPAYTTPAGPGSCWKRPGPAAGPFRARLGDGTVVTYYWYRFADQPALLNAGLTQAEREKMQARVEKLQRLWTRNHNYLAPPASGQLADIDPALIVKPPSGLGVGYVPIATRQEAERRSMNR